MNTVILTVLVILATQVCVYCTIPYIVRNEISRENLNSSKHYRTSSNTISSTCPSENTRRMSGKKWQVGRVSRKHYEIVNMLWRKTKVFVTEESISTENNIIRNKPRHIKSTSSMPNSFTTNWPLPQSSTPSYIEFYYLYDNDDRIKRRDSLVPRNNFIHNEQLLPNGPSNILSFRVNDPASNIMSTVIPAPKLNNEKPNRHSKSFRRNHPLYDFILSKIESKFTAKRNTKPRYNQHITNLSTSISQFETCPNTIQETKHNVTSLSAKSSTFQSTKTTSNNTIYGRTSTSNKLYSTTSASSPYDKIKFFEIHDKHTALPSNEDQKENIFYIYVDNLGRDEYADNNQKLLLKDVNVNLGHHDGLNQKFVKKHIDGDFDNDIPNDKLEENFTFQSLVLEESNETNIIKSVKHKSFLIDVENEDKYNNSILESTRIASRPASWSNYPFAAVYIYEPSQIHCDAAAISSHWLVASASCLSRYRNRDLMTGRSAFVVYCSANWWTPSRVSYVKYSVVHPRYHPKDNSRRYLYNIGLVQVASSMSSCFGWGPVSLMSHQFAASATGSAATAVGWGLDRYDVSRSSKLPRKPLSVYNGIIFSTSCPGNRGYSKLKALDEDLTKNFYCLLLPHYNGEENDPVHGSMLLVGGKLIALYIQEERRPVGVQSAQYTGIWGLVPWIHEVAREPEDGELFELDV